MPSTDKFNAGPLYFGGISMVTATRGPNDPKVGDRVTWEGEDYIFVYNAGGEQIDPGLGAVVSAVSGYSVTVSSTASLMAGGIGVCKHATLTTDTYGWLLSRGFSSYEAGGNVSAGEGLSLAADGTWVNASGITGPIYGKAMIATDSGGSATAYFSFGF